VSEPCPAGSIWNTAQDDGPLLMRFRHQGLTDAHDMQSGEADFVTQPTLHAGLLLAEVEVR
jgi:hypothetical protein